MFVTIIENICEFLNKTFEIVKHFFIKFLEEDFDPIKHDEESILLCRRKVFFKHFFEELNIHARGFCVLFYYPD